MLHLLPKMLPNSLKLKPSKHVPVKVNNRNTRKSCEICSRLTTKTPEQCQWRRSSVFIVNVGHTLYLFSDFHCCFEQIIVRWEFKTTF